MDPRHDNPEYGLFSDERLAELRGIEQDALMAHESAEIGFRLDAIELEDLKALRRALKERFAGRTEEVEEPEED